MPRLAILEAYCINPGDVSWAPLARLAELTLYDRTPPEELIARASGFEAILTNKVPITDRDLAHLPELKYIGVLATGFNVIDTGSAAERGVIVTNIPAYGNASVAEHTFALLLELTKRCGHHDGRVAEGAWVQSPDWSFFEKPLVELSGKTLGVFGFGRIGQAVARMGQAFGMPVIAHSPRADRASMADVDFVGFEELFLCSDVVSLHAPLTPQTLRVVNEVTLALMRPSAFLINTARGALIDEHALAHALHQGRLAGAGLDVLSTEPPTDDNPLLHAPNVVITPHNAWATVEARRRLIDLAAANYEAWLAGSPMNVVN